MTPAEVLAMRDWLAVEICKTLGGGEWDSLAKLTADWLIESGWVTEEPKEKSE